MTIPETIFGQPGGKTFWLYTGARLIDISAALKDEPEYDGGLRVVFRRSYNRIKKVDILYMPGPDAYRHPHGPFRLVRSVARRGHDQAR